MVQVGDPPFKSLSGDPWDTFRQALSGRFFVPPSLSAEASDIIYKLLQVQPCPTSTCAPAAQANAHHRRATGTCVPYAA